MLSLRSVAMASLCSLCVAAVARSGDLNPPGAPGSTMKTLDEVEARIPIGPLTTPGDASATHIISQPGSYYLTGNLNGELNKHGIRITTGDVTLDLNGFTLEGGGGQVSGVTMDNYRSNITIRDGVVRGWVRHGMDLRADNSLVEHVRFESNTGYGLLNAGSYGGLLRQCQFYYNGQVNNVVGGGAAWDSSIISECHASNNEGIGLVGALVRGCVVEVTTSDLDALQPGRGIVGTLVESCVVRSSAAVGIVADTLVRGCVSTFNTGGAYTAPNVVESY